MKLFIRDNPGWFSRNGVGSRRNWRERSTSRRQLHATRVFELIIMKTLRAVPHWSRNVLAAGKMSWANSTQTNNIALTCKFLYAFRCAMYDYLLILVLCINHTFTYVPKLAISNIQSSMKMEWFVADTCRIVKLLHVFFQN